MNIYGDPTFLRNTFKVKCFVQTISGDVTFEAEQIYFITPIAGKLNGQRDNNYLVDDSKGLCIGSIDEGDWKNIEEYFEELEE